MKFIFNKQEMVSAINNVTRAISPKSTLPALEGLKLRLDENELELTGYDLEIGIITTINVKSNDVGEVLFEAKLFSDIVRKMSSEEIMVDIDSALNVTITGGVTEYKISAMPADEYPEIPSCKKENAVTISQSLLKNMIGQTIFAVATSDNKPILKGELFDIENNVFNLVAIDGYRLAVRSEQIQTNDDYYFVVPTKTLSEALKLLSDDDELTCTIYTSRKHIIFDISGYQLLSRLLEGDFHNYKGSIPAEHTTEIIVNTKSLINSIERCSLVINDRIKSPVRCVFNDGRLKISCTTSIGKFSDEMEVDISGPMVEIGFNNRYLLEALKATESDKVKLLMKGGLSPMKIVPLSGDGFVFLVLPVRLRTE